MPLMRASGWRCAALCCRCSGARLPSPVPTHRPRRSRWRRRCVTAACGASMWPAAAVARWTRCIHASMGVLHSAGHASALHCAGGVDETQHSINPHYAEQPPTLGGALRCHSSSEPPGSCMHAGVLQCLCWLCCQSHVSWRRAHADPLACVDTQQPSSQHACWPAPSVQLRSRSRSRSPPAARALDRRPQAPPPPGTWQRWLRQRCRRRWRPSLSA